MEINYYYNYCFYCNYYFFYYIIPFNN